MNEEIGAGGAGVPVSQEERTWGMVAVLSAFAGYIVPFAGIVAPIVIYFMKREESAFVAFHALQTIYFEIAVFVLILLCIPLAFLCIGVPLMIVIGLGAIVYVIVVALKAYKGEWAEFWLVGGWARSSVRK
jgi:hypothetical protein